MYEKIVFNILRVLLIGVSGALIKESINKISVLEI